MAEIPAALVHCDLCPQKFRPGELLAHMKRRHPTATDADWLRASKLVAPVYPTDTETM